MLNILECSSTHHMSYNQINNFVNDFNLTDEIVFKQFITNSSNFLLLSNKKEMKLLEDYSRKNNITVQKFIEDSIDVILTNNEIDKKNKTFNIKADDIEFNFRVILKK